jgi:hypothetical protein
MWGNCTTSILLLGMKIVQLFWKTVLSFPTKLDTYLLITQYMPEKHKYPYAYENPVLKCLQEIYSNEKNLEATQMSG